MLGLPDDFKYQGEPFFVYYQAKLVENLNRFRINKNFRSESLKRMKMAKSVAARLLEEAPEGTELGYIQSDGSYLFNFRILVRSPTPTYCCSAARWPSTGASPRSRIRRGSYASRWAGTSPPARKA